MSDSPNLPVLPPERFRRIGPNPAPWHVSIATPRGEEWINTGQSTLELAQAVCSAADVEQWQVKRSAEILVQDLGAKAAGTRTISDALVQEWVAWLTPQIAPVTLRTYASDVRACFTALFYWDKPLTVSSHETLSAFVNKSGKQGTRMRRRDRLLSFYNYVHQMGYLPGNPAKLVRILLREMTVAERTKKETIPFTLAEMRQLQSAEPMKVFWKVAIPLAFWTGLRLRDIACLQWDSIRETGLLIYQQKTGDRVEHKFADLALEPGAEAEVRAALALIEWKEAVYCFPRERKLILRGADLYDEFKRVVVRRCGMDSSRTFHGIRHGTAVRMRAQGQPIGAIAAKLGHRSRWSTDTYLDHSPAPPAVPACADDCI